MADARLIGLIASLRSSAEAALGEHDSPVAHSLERDGLLRRRTAERSLELLDMLAQKTRGNLDELEHAALEGARSSVRGRLERSEASGDADGAGGPSGAGGPGGAGGPSGTGACDAGRD